MSIKPPPQQQQMTTTTTTLCICAVLLHFAGFIVCTALPVIPDINYTPPLEFPSTSNKYIRIIEANNTTLNNLTKTPISSNGNNDQITIVEPTAKLQAEIKRQLNDELLRSSSQPINVIARISENYTGNYIENKYYTNHIEESWSSITLTLLVLTVMAVIILAFSALCLKKVQNLKISKQQLLKEECYDSVMSDLINVQHV